MRVLRCDSRDGRRSEDAKCCKGFEVSLNACPSSRITSGYGENASRPLHWCFPISTSENYDHLTAR